MGEHQQSAQVRAIRIPLSSIASYVAYVALGMATGVLAIWIARQQGSQTSVLGGNMLLYSAAVFAHFRFAYGLSDWPPLERGNWRKAMSWGVAMSFIGYIAIAFIGVAWGRHLEGPDDSWHLRPEAHLQVASRYLSEIPALIVIGIDACIVAPIAEEIIFRSGLYRICKGRVSITAAAVISSAIFALGHRSVIASVPLFVLGCLCCWIYEKTADIRGPIIFHAGYNFLVYVPVLLV